MILIAAPCCAETGECPELALKRIARCASGGSAYWGNAEACVRGVEPPMSRKRRYAHWLGQGHVVGDKPYEASRGSGNLR